MKRLRRTPMFLTAAVAAAVVVGALEFPHALGPVPGATGVTVLNLLVDHGRGNTTNDWFLVSGSAREERGELRVVSPAGPLTLILASRTLPVFPHDCYELELDGRARGPRLTGGVYDESLRTRLEPFVLEPGAVHLHLAFTPGGRLRVSVLVFGGHRATFLLRRAAITRPATKRCGIAPSG